MRLALFDLDHTLLAGDSGYIWQNYLAEIRAVDDVDLHNARNLRFADDYNAGVLNYPSFIQFMLQPLVDNSLSTLCAWREDFVERRIRPLIKSKALELLKYHREKNDTLVMISATNSFITEPIATLLDIPHLISTVPELIDGRYTGNLVGSPCFREGKIKCLNAWVKKTKRSLAGASFYSDSSNDIPLLAYVDHPFAVDPDPLLQNHAESYGWPIIMLSKEVCI